MANELQIRQWRAEARKHIAISGEKTHWWQFSKRRKQHAAMAANQTIGSALISERLGDVAEAIINHRGVTEQLNEAAGLLRQIVRMDQDGGQGDQISFLASSALGWLDRYEGTDQQLGWLDPDEIFSDDPPILAGRVSNET